MHGSASLDCECVCALKVYQKLNAFLIFLKNLQIPHVETLTFVRLACYCCHSSRRPSIKSSQLCTFSFYTSILVSPSAVSVFGHNKNVCKSTNKSDGLFAALVNSTWGNFKFSKTHTAHFFPANLVRKTWVWNLVISISGAARALSSLAWDSKCRNRHTNCGSNFFLSWRAGHSLQVFSITKTTHNIST